MSNDSTSVDIDILTRAFPPHALKQRTVGGGRPLTYVEGHTVIHRLNEATGNHWDFRVVALDSREVASKDRQGNPRTDLLMMATVELTLPGLGTRQHVGVQLVSPGSGEDLVKGAITDALKKAATLFGVGLELYGPDYEAGEVDAPTRAQAPQRPPQQSIDDPLDFATTRGRRMPQPPAESSPAPDPNALTDRQRKFIFACGRQCGLEADEVERWALDTYGCSVGSLTRRDASAFIETLLRHREGREDGPHGAAAPSAQADPEPDGIVSWGEFWQVVEGYGIVRDKGRVEKALGQSLGANPQAALELVRARLLDAQQRPLAPV